jgi:chemotaxis protein CheC
MKSDLETIDAIREIINIGIGKAAAQLSDLTHYPIILEIPEVRIVSLSDLSSLENIDKDHSMATVYLEFSGALTGKTALMIPRESAADLVSLLTNEEYDSEEMDAVMIDTLKEVGNIIANSVMGVISNILNEHLTYSIPSYYQTKILSFITESELDQEKQLIFADSKFSMKERNIRGQILIILDIGSIDTIMSRIGATSGKD